MKNKHIFFPSCPCSCPSVLSSSMDLRDVSPNTGSPAARDKWCWTHPPTHRHFKRWLSRGQGVGRLSQTPTCLHPAPVRTACCNTWLLGARFWIAVCLIFSPPTLPASLLSSVPFWLPAFTLLNTQPPYLPPPPPTLLPCSLSLIFNLTLTFCSAPVY